MTDSLVAFLRARLAEDKRIAVQACSSSLPKAEAGDDAWEWVNSRW